MNHSIAEVTIPEVEGFFDQNTNTVTYLVKDPNSNSCAVYDSVMDIDYAAGKISDNNAMALIETIQERALSLEWIVETHVHADHLSAAPYLQEKLGGKIAIGAQIRVVQETFGKFFNEGTEFQRDGSQFDLLLNDGDHYFIGGLDVRVMETPGHTPACMAHIIGDACITGDTLFMPDSGSARADFPGGDAGMLYDSIQKILSLPDETRLFLCHDYGASGTRAVQWETTVAEEKRANIHVKYGKTRDDFIRFRNARDANLNMPSLIIPSLQVNMRAGDIPKDVSGNPILKVPLNKL